MKEFVKSMDGLPLLVKLLLCIPAIHIIWGLYRIVSALDAGNLLAIVVSIVLLFVPVMWIIDLISVLLLGHVLKLA